MAGTVLLKRVFLPNTPALPRSIPIDEKTKGADAPEAVAVSMNPTLAIPVEVLVVAVPTYTRVESRYISNNAVGILAVAKTPTVKFTDDEVDPRIFAGIVIEVGKVHGAESVPAGQLAAVASVAELKQLASV